MMSRVPFADVIFPIFSAPFIFSLFMPWILAPALAAEVFVFKLIYRQSSWGTITSGVLGANAVSWLFGILVAFFLLPSEIREHPSNGAIDFVPGMMKWAFIYAFVVSIVIETVVWWVSQKTLQGNRLLFATFLANVASYALLIGGVFLFTSR